MQIEDNEAKELSQDVALAAKLMRTEAGRERALMDSSGIGNASYYKRRSKNYEEAAVRLKRWSFRLRASIPLDGPIV